MRSRRITCRTRVKRAGFLFPPRTWEIAKNILRRKDHDENPQSRVVKCGRNKKHSVRVHEPFAKERRISTTVIALQSMLELEK